MVLRRTKMNIGFYIHTSGATEQNREIFDALNEAVENKDVTDASIFYNDIDYNPVKPKFGMFNATEIWSFTGVLVATSLENTIKAHQIVNKFKLLYLHEKQEKNLLLLLDVTNRVPVIVRNKEDSKEVYRLTGRKPKIFSKLSIKKILEAS